MRAGESKEKGPATANVDGPGLARRAPGEPSHTLILAAESPLPPRSGVRLRVLHLARQLARSSQVDVAVLGPAGRAADEPFELSSIPHHRSRSATAMRAWRSPYVVAKQRSEAMAALAAVPRWDTVQVEFPSLVPAACGTRVPVVLDAHNVESDLLGSIADQASSGPSRLRLRWEEQKMRRFERRVVTNVAAVCATSDADAEVFERWGAAEVVVVPNGVDTAAIPHRRTPVAGARLLYVGHLGYEPNAAAARELARDVLPLVRAEVPDASVRLVGRDGARLCSLAGQHVELAGEVPEVLPELRAARAVVLPLRAGSGTRLKVLEAMAAGVPIVATPLAVAGIALRDGEHVLLGATPRELAAQVVRVCCDDALASALSDQARDLAARAYDWSIVGEPLRELHERLAASVAGCVGPRVRVPRKPDYPGQGNGPSGR